MTRWHMVAGLLVLALSGTAGYLAFDPTFRTPPAQAAADPTVPVVLAVAKQRAVPVTIGVIGTVEAYSTVSVKSRVDGQLIAAHFTEGQAVKRGDLLFTIDPRPYEAQVAQAEATLEGARKDLERYQQLAKQSIVPRQQLDQAAATEKANAATVKADQAALAFARLQLEYTRIYSPVDGRTGSILVHAGNLVKANDTTGLVTINQVEPIHVTFSVPEKYLPEIKRRMAEGTLRVTATAPGDDGPPSEGTVSFVNNAADPTTGTIQLKGTFANEDERLTPGQLVDTVLTLYTLQSAVTVPEAAVQSSQSGPAVFVVKPDMTVELRPVTVGISEDGYSVIEEGIAPGERVVVEGQLRLANGTKVRAVMPTPSV